MIKYWLPKIEEVVKLKPLLVRTEEIWKKELRFGGSLLFQAEKDWNEPRISGCTKGSISAEISAWCRSYYKLKISQLSIEVRLATH
ncbi:hypothetical protein ACMD2_13459 [Ananas comosus]|uniref:Uncharacterized protein n=1 Tax=Ananas comosus TaxID=4615 RepID=A0A199VKV6_ANACO|nr:hypothetical protein ACMD2_13459 [Ananas comosus]